MRLLLAVALFAATPAHAFDPIAFFTGASEGQGRLKVMMRRAREVRVESRGAVLADGTLVVDQTVAEEGKPPKTRQWRIRQVAPGRYEGSLSDAKGPVAGVSEGDALVLTFRAKGDVAVEQVLTLAPDGRSARNRLTARKFGMVVARLDETIRRLDEP